MKRVYQSTFLDGRVLEVGYCFERDVYVIAGKNPAEGVEKHIVLSQEAMREVMKHYALLLRYQAEVAPDGVGADLA